MTVETTDKLSPKVGLYIVCVLFRGKRQFRCEED